VLQIKRSAASVGFSDPDFLLGTDISAIREDLPIYFIDIYRVYIGYFRSKISDIFDIYDFCGFFLFFNVKHCDSALMSTVRVFCWLMTCALSIFPVLDNFSQIAPLHSNAV